MCASCATDKLKVAAILLNMFEQISTLRDKLFHYFSQTQYSQTSIMKKLSAPLPLLTVLLLLSALYGQASYAQESVQQEIVQQETVQQENPPPVTNGEQSPFDQQASDREKVWLNVAGRKELAFYLNEASGKAHGGVLLIPDAGHHPAVEGMINSLRHSLANNHWHTLAIDVEGTSETITQQTIAAGIQYLNQQGVFNIAILGEGLGAAQATHYVAALPQVLEPGQLQQIRALLMINADNHIPDSKVNTLQKLSGIQLPILDAYRNNDYLEQRLAHERKLAARRLMTRNYQEIRLPLSSGYQKNYDDRITKRIRGWLDKNVAGFMVDQTN
jgi:hypothetical protein